VVAEWKGDVLGHRHVREQRVVLEHEPDVALVGRQGHELAAPHLDAATVGPEEAGDDHQQRRLARAGRAEQREELPGPDVEVESRVSRSGPVHDALVRSGRATYAGRDRDASHLASEAGSR
jgi:hypothetical protein